jgi:hypothetical protein
VTGWPQSENPDVDKNVAVGVSEFQTVPHGATRSPQLLETEVVENRQNWAEAENRLGPSSQIVYIHGFTG